jgi:hypothetical protein
MATNLVMSSDLSARGVDTTDGTLVEMMLAAASALVRDAARSPILREQVTVSWWVTESGEYVDIPVRPVASVESVMFDGVTVEGWKHVHNTLWRRGGWRVCEPTEVSAKMVVGLLEVPADIRQLVADLAILGMATATTGAADPRVAMESIDDYSVTFARNADGAAFASAMSLPPAVRRSLRARFGGGVGSVRMR